MIQEALKTALLAHALEIVGGFHPEPADKTPEGCQTLLMLGPAPGFWEHFTTTAEFRDQAADPMDRWSQRILGQVGETFNATGLFPFGGPPYLPFFSWALRTGRVWQSPIRLLVHDSAGLFLSFRGALAFGERMELPETTGVSPCSACVDHSCLDSCPTGAMTAGAYDLSACHDFLDTAPGQNCMSRGCVVRRSCPVSRRFDRDPRQSAFHMSHFHSPPGL